MAALLVVAAMLYFAGRAFGLWGADQDGPLRLYGNVEIREVQLGFRVPGRIDKLLVDEGDRVIRGQVLAQLDTRPLQDRLAGADARAMAASATAARDANGARPQELGEARAEVAAAEAALAEARRQYDRRLALIEKGFISKADVQTAEAALRSAQARVAQASAALSLVAAGTRIEDQAASQATREAVLAERRAAQTDLDDTVIRAPEPGQVLTRAREAGAIVTAGQTVLTLALTQPVRVRAYVAEPDLHRVKPGMPVKVRTDGTSREWAARVGFVSPVAEFTPKTVQTEQLRTDLVYRVRLIVEDPGGDLRQGAPVTVVIPDAPVRN
ncbi:HlyD family secretion protein [Novosphingobium kunmingense]|uniref:HlyD family secretion protein n=1 Tax=Novosphingobium kunmingense TaxID=1211806 RepID=A0A2N0I321_9SPHN|nr:efflux RND transporter periplasmic adaptor subunit [Novosphingobium kunmingense]PKB25589.1 HlyD family secretion protein [Novosphingobium kunmingense]